MAEMEVGSCAYVKMVLHALKYPHAAVNGVLLAEKSKHSNRYHIVDAIPCLHLNLNLTPSMEVALCQIDAYCQHSPNNLQIAGCYQANQRLTDSSPNFPAHRLAEKIMTNFPDAVLFMIDNRSLSVNCEKPVYRAYQFHDSRWKQRDGGSVPLADEDQALTVTCTAIQSRLYRQLIDFDNHLDDISLDFLNKSLNARIDELIQEL